MNISHINYKARLKRQRELDRELRTDLKAFDKETDIARVRYPKNFRQSMIAWCVADMIVGMVLTIYALILGIVDTIWFFISLTLFFIFGGIFKMIYPQAHEADERTRKVAIGDMPPISSAEHIPGAHLITLAYPRKLKKSKGEQFDYHTYEVIRMGDYTGMWQRSSKPVFAVVKTQFSPGDDGVNRHGGYMVGNTYHIPVKVRPYTFRMLQASRDPRLARELKRIEGIGSDIKPSTWILLGMEAISIPSGIPQASGAIDEKELLFLTRMLNKANTRLAAAGKTEVKLESLNI